MKYQDRLLNFSPGENTNCENYQVAISFAKENGFTMSRDVSYNGFIYFEKIINNAEDKLEIKIYDGIKMNKAHWFSLYEKTADFGQSILSETRYYFKERLSYTRVSIQELFKLTLEKKKELCNNS